MDSVNTILNYAKVAFGLGFVIFLHELGHFLLAKWNGVKVEKFYIGFGPPLVAFTYGETEYAIALLPLGGFVKMLGESPEEESDESATSDPRAYQNKSIGARMSIISAGVIMNYILGITLFTISHMLGSLDQPPVIGLVATGSPAYIAGVRAGDEIMAIDGKRDLAFTDLSRKSSLSSAGQKLHMELKRPGRSEPVIVDVEPLRRKGQIAPIVGVASSQSLTLVRPMDSAPYPFIPLPGMGTEGLPSLDEIKAGNVLLEAAVEGEPARKLQTIQEFSTVLDAAADKPLILTIQKTSNEGAKTVNEQIKFPPNHMLDFGFRVEFDKITAIVTGSIAEQAKFQVGDKILKVNGNADIDPLRLPSICRQNAGKEMTFVVDRDGKEVTLTATPDATPISVESLGVSETAPGIPREPVDVAGLGLAYHVGRTIVTVAPGSPAEKAGLKPNDVIDTVNLPAFKVPGEKKLETPRKTQLVELKGENPISWWSVFKHSQSLPCDEPFQFTISGKSEKVDIKPEPVADWFFPERGLSFGALIREVPAAGIVAAIGEGLEDTWETIGSVGAMVRGLVYGRIGSKGVAGLPRMFDMASYAAEAGYGPLFQFLAMLSINLAVLNFLPIPPLDGGQMVFLIGEKIRGRPLPVAAVNAAVIIGVVLVLSLMVFTNGQDILIKLGYIK